MTTNRLDYITAKVVVDKDNLEQMFAQYPTKRRVRSSQVKNLLNVLKSGKSFPVMYVNRASTVSDKNVILDGNHRLEALRQYFSLVPDAKVELRICIYDITDPEEEREKFRELNNIVKPNSDDAIQQYVESNYFLKKLLQKVKICSVYGSAKRPLKVRVLMTAYILGIKNKWSATSISGQDLVKHMENYGDSDIKVIQAFLAEYQEIYGMLEKDSIWLKTTVFTVMFRIWYQNRNLPVSGLKKKFRSLINHRYLLEYGKLGGREACHMAAERFIDVMNRSARKNVLVLENLEE